MNLTRRVFLASIAAAPCASAFRGPRMRLQAISGPLLPHTLVIPALPVKTGYFELREYQSAGPLRVHELHPLLLGALARSGIRPLLWSCGDNLTYVFQFDSLAARAEAWTAFASDPAWRLHRESMRTTSVGIYRAA